MDNEHLEYEAGEDRIGDFIEQHLETLQDYFINLREYKEIPITKSNVEALFEEWVGEQDMTALINIIEQ